MHIGSPPRPALCFLWLSAAFIEPGSRGFPLITNKEPTEIMGSLRVPKLPPPPNYPPPVSPIRSVFMSIPNQKELSGLSWIHMYTRCNALVFNSCSSYVSSYLSLLPLSHDILSHAALLCSLHRLPEYLCSSDGNYLLLGHHFLSFMTSFTQYRASAGQVLVFNLLSNLLNLLSLKCLSKSVTHNESMSCFDETARNLDQCCNCWLLFFFFLSLRILVDQSSY